MSRKKRPETVASVWGLRCPHCGADDQLQIQLTTWALLTPGGTIADSHHHDWHDRSQSECLACDHTGIVADFMIDHQRRARRAKGGPS